MNPKVIAAAADAEADRWKHHRRANGRARTFLALTAASLALWLSVAGQPEGLVPSHPV